MRTPRHSLFVTSTTSLSAGLGLSAALFAAGCQGVLGDDPDGDGDNPFFGEGDGDLTDPNDPNLDDPRTCVPGIPATSQIPRLLNREYDAVVKDLLDVTSLTSGSAPSTLLVPDYDGSLTDIAWNSYLVAARDIAAQVISGPNRERFISCDPATPGCLTDTIRTFGRKAFRRPLTDTEVASFERLSSLDPPGTPDEIAQATLYAFLASPSFLTIAELDQTKNGDNYALSQHEIAARLSFLLWGSVPDETLSAAADSGELTTKEQILAQAQRLIQDRGRTAPIVRQFHKDYAFIKDGSHWATLEHDPALFPEYSAAALPAMMEEIEAFFEEVTFAGGAFRDLFLSNVGFVNQDTAAIYDLDATSYGPDLSPVTFDAEERPGFLTRAGFLSSYSGYSSTSPILRGAYISERILGIEIAAPPPGATEKPVPPGDYQSNREIVDALTSPQPCGGCHNTYINPPGFVLEKFDAVGGVQVNDPLGGPIDGTADVYFTDDEATTVTSPLQLMEGIASAEEARRRYAEAWVSFGSKRDPNSNDACVVDELSTKISNDGFSILHLLIELTQADTFTQRKLGN